MKVLALCGSMRSRAENRGRMVVPPVEAVYKAYGEGGYKVW
jgi:NAD(P)H-dependent FMN reductase